MIATWVASSLYPVMQIWKAMVAIVGALSTALFGGGNGRSDASGDAYGDTSGGFSMHSRDSAGNGSTLVDDGNGCMLMSTPSGSISSGC
jgi:hypothetical protein